MATKAKLMQAQRELNVELWNAKHAVGTAVNVRLDSGEVKATTTLSEAIMLGGHTPCVKVEGISGYYDLSRVSKA